MTNERVSGTREARLSVCLTMHAAGRDACHARMSRAVLVNHVRAHTFAAAEYLEK